VDTGNVAGMPLVCIW